MKKKKKNENSSKIFEGHDHGACFGDAITQIEDYFIQKKLQLTPLRRKVFEILSLLFNISKEMDTEQCPFLADDKNVKKIKMAKEIIIARMSEPPSLKELADQVEISLKNLKEGFKQVYGNTVFGYLYDHKMNVASQMLSTKNYNVNEVALHLGYSTASHFINAFKNKFGTTPKKYLNNSN